MSDKINTAECSFRESALQMALSFLHNSPARERDKLTDIELLDVSEKFSNFILTGSVPKDMNKKA